jgi:hypothetical protein
MPPRITPEGQTDAYANFFSVCAGFVNTERLSTFACVTTLDRVRLMLRPALHLNHFHGLCHRASCRSGYPGACLSGFGINWQLSRQVRCNLLDLSVTSIALLSPVYGHLSAWLRIK